MALFRYPSIRHTRRLDPGPFSDYRKYKPHLREEFDCKCVYCLMPDCLKSTRSFGVDHYRPKRRFPSLASTYSNLFYACNECNGYKWMYWPTDTEKRRGQYVPNPCDHVMDAHLQYRKDEVSAKSVTGEFAIELLDLNAPDAIEYRRDLQLICRSLELEIEDLRRTLRDIQKRIRRTRIAKVKFDLEGDELECRSTLDAALRLLAQISK